MKFYPDIKKKIDHLLYYSLKKVFSFCVAFMYLIGGRRYGKTYSIKSFIFKDFVDNGNKFAWVRSTDRALEKCSTPSRFFGRMKNLAKLGVDHYDIKNGVIYINHKEAGYFFSVATFYNDKGADYECTNGVYDEFMRAKGERPVPDKRRKFMDLVESVFRQDGKRIFLLSNSTNQFDEMLQPFNLTLKEYGCYLYREKDAVIHYIRSSKKHIKHMEEGLSGKGMTEQDKKMAFKNEFTDFGDYGSIEKAKLLFCVQVDDDKWLKLYTDPKDKLFVKCDMPKKNEQIYSRDPTYVNAIVKKLPQSALKVLRGWYDNGSSIFADGYARTMFQELIK